MKLRTKIKNLINPLLKGFNARIDSAKNGEVAGEELDHDLPLLISRFAPVCIDVGANVGQTINLFRRTLNSPIIHAFEPSRQTFRELQKNTQGISDVSLYQQAAGAEPGTASFNVIENSELSSLLQPLQFPWMAEGEKYLQTSETVTVTTIDQFIEEHRFSSVDILKSDTQGYDLNVLLGAERSLTAGKIRYVLVELNFCVMYEGQNSAHELIGYLEKLNYHLVDFYERVRKPSHNATLSWCTALFGRRD